MRTTLKKNKNTLINKIMIYTKNYQEQDNGIESEHSKEYIGQPADGAGHDEGSYEENDGYRLLINERHFYRGNDPESTRQNRVITLAGQTLSGRTDIVSIWNRFNTETREFDTFYDGKSERHILQSIFNQLISISRSIGIGYDDIPSAVFCATKDDLIKLDQIMLRVQTQLLKNERERLRERENKSMCNLL